MDSELKLKKQAEELTVRDTTLDTFVLTVAMVTESCGTILHVHMYQSTNTIEEDQHCCFQFVTSLHLLIHMKRFSEGYTT